MDSISVLSRDHRTIDRAVHRSNTLRLLEYNDPALTDFALSSGLPHITAVRSNGIEYGMRCYWPGESADLVRLGNLIGSNTNVKVLTFDNAHELTPTADDCEALLGGLDRNISINVLRFVRCDLFRGLGLDILREFVSNNSTLKDITLQMCTLGDGAAGLVSAMSGCSHLKSVTLSRISGPWRVLSRFILGIRGLTQLRRVSLRGNSFALATCEALAILIQTPDCNLTHISLSDNGIDDDGAKIIAASLKNNCKLLCLWISGNAITQTGYGSFSRILCDRSSLDATFHSNHTLNDLGSILHLPINPLLTFLNRGLDKKQVAVQKILLCHANLDMEPLLEWDLKVLPLAVTWFDRARNYARDDESNIYAQNEESNVDARKLSAVYQFVRALPMECIPSAAASGKRKRS